MGVTSSRSGHPTLAGRPPSYEDRPEGATDRRARQVHGGVQTPVSGSVSQMEPGRYPGNSTGRRDFARSAFPLCAGNPLEPRRQAVNPKGAREFRILLHPGPRVQFPDSRFGKNVRLFEYRVRRIRDGEFSALLLLKFLQKDFRLAHDLIAMRKRTTQVKVTS